MPQSPASEPLRRAPEPPALDPALLAFVEALAKADCDNDWNWMMRNGGARRMLVIEK